MNKYDQDGDGDFDMADVFRIALPVLVYTLSIIGMLITAIVSWHLFSSQLFNPMFGTWTAWVWPLAVAGISELGLTLSWVCLHVGISKGKLTRGDWSMAVMTLLGIAGLVIFGALIAAMQLYDRELLAGKDLTEVAGWGHTIASTLPLFTIVYSIVVGAAYAALQRQEKESSSVVAVRQSWQVENRKPVEQTPRLPKETYGTPVSDPLRHRRAEEALALKVREAVASGKNGNSPLD